MNMIESDFLQGRPLVLEDTTLRDGEQAPGVAFDPATKTRILDGLIDAGVKSVEVGIPAMGGDELDFLRSIVDRQDEARLVPWHRGVREDIAVSLDLGFRAVHVGLPASDAHLSQSVGRDRAWLLRTARDLVSYAKDRGAFVSISAEDLARTDPDFLIEYAGVVEAAGADRLRLSDTIGILTPEGYAGRVAAINEACDIALQCHAHNDFGLAVANTLAGLKAGATYFHVTFNGIGERAGMADIVQMVTILQHLYGVDLGIDIPTLVRISDAVSVASRHQPPPWQPLTGENVFAHESGIHVNAMLKDTSSFEPISPDVVGRTRRYVLGKHSGRAMIRTILTDKTVPFDDQILADCLREVRALSTRLGGEVSTDQLLDIYQVLMADRSAAGTRA
jgi:homocitrate synthase NifV